LAKLLFGLEWNVEMLKILAKLIKINLEASLRLNNDKKLPSFSIPII